MSDGKEQIRLDSEQTAELLISLLSDGEAHILRPNVEIHTEEVDFDNLELRHRLLPRVLAKRE